MFLKIFYFVIGNNTELFHLVILIYAQGNITCFETYNFKNIGSFKQDSSLDIEIMVSLQHLYSLSLLSGSNMLQKTQSNSNLRVSLAFYNKLF